MLFGYGCFIELEHGFSQGNLIKLQLAKYYSKNLYHHRRQHLKKNGS